MPGRFTQMLGQLAIVAMAALPACSNQNAPQPKTEDKTDSRPRAVHPAQLPNAIDITTANYRIRSDAKEQQVRLALVRMEAVHGLASSILAIESGPRMELVLFDRRDEFRHAFPNAGWAEALYLKPIAYAYADADTARFEHWMLHEGAHQFLRERTAIQAPRWIEEGLASWFSTMAIKDGVPDETRLDPATYPVWWFPDVAAASGNSGQSVSPQSLIKASILFGYDSGPDPNRHVNAYYVSSLLLVRFLMQGDAGRYRESFVAFLESPGTRGDFERTLGWISELDARWQYEYRLAAWPSERLSESASP